MTTKQQLTTKDGQEYKPSTEVAPFKQGKGKYEPWMDQKAYELLTKGKSKAHVCAAIGVSHETLNQWLNPDSEYFAGDGLSEAIKKGVKYSEATWMDIGYDGMTGKIKGFNVVAWIFNMKNRFKWQDKHDHEVKATHELSHIDDDSLKDQAMKLLGVDDVKAIDLKPEDYEEVGRDKRRKKK
jgi:hypothetical protein